MFGGLSVCDEGSRRASAMSRRDQSFSGERSLLCPYMVKSESPVRGSEGLFVDDDANVADVSGASCNLMVMVPRDWKLM